MAMLEMIKTDDIVFRQSELFGPIWIYRKKNNPEYAEEMAHETVFFSKDPEVKSGLVDTIRSQAIARSKEKSVGDLAATMREAVLWTERGRNVTEEDLNAMLEGREDISEVQDNPFADMIAEADAAEGALQAASAPAGDATQPAATENAENTEASLENAETQHTFEPIDEPEEISEKEVVENFEDEFNEKEFNEDEFDEDEIDDAELENEEIVEESDEPKDESSESTFQGLNEQAVQQMSDEEFAAFMQKAQAFYNNASSTPAQSTTSSAKPATDSYKSSSSDWDEPTPSAVQSVQKEEPEEDKYSSYSFGNEMTDEEYIAYLNRSARASRKDELKPAPTPATPEKPAEKKIEKKPERKSFMPEEDEEGGMTDEEYQAYLAEHGDDDEDDEGPVVYGAGKD